MAELNQRQLKLLVQYDEDTGSFVWLKRTVELFKTQRACSTWNSRFTNKTAGSFDNSTGYMVIRINGKDYYQHRLAWLYVYGEPPESIDHINHNKTDNRICNLRSVLCSENSKNLSLSKDNKSGVNGVIWHKKACKWQAYINVNKKSVYLGLSGDLFDAACLRKSAEIKYNFHENHGK